jgi:outer membrane protein assembly factor BamE
MFLLRALAVMAASLLASCGSMQVPMTNLMSAHRIEIQQGNFVSQEMVSQLKPGMSKDQVRFVMGTPLIADSFHGDRWDYVFRRQKANSKELEHRKVTVFFVDGKLSRIEGDVTPAAGADAAGAGPAVAQQLPAPVAAPEPKPAAQTVSEAPKPAAAVNPEKPAAAPAPAGDGKTQEKSWWERLKEKLTP